MLDITRLEAISFNAAKEKLSQVPPTTAISWLMIGIAIIATILSMFDICSSACTDAALYTLFGLSFAWIGLIFFFLLAGLFSFRADRKIALLVDCLCFSAGGAEIFFLLVQRYGIGHWCPTCVTIATAVIILASTRLFVGIKESPSKAKAVSMVPIAALFVIVGFITALVGIESPEGAEQAQAVAVARPLATLSNQDIWMGNRTSEVEVYFVSDWYCPFCRVLEKSIDKMLPELGKTAQYTFMDLRIHRESAVLTPFHTSLLLGDKSQYVAGRKVLLAMSAEKKDLAPAEIMIALSDAGVYSKSADYVSASIVESLSAVFFSKNNVRSTPSVVIVNKVTKRQQIIAVPEDITAKNIQAAISAVSQNEAAK